MNEKSKRRLSPLTAYLVAGALFAACPAAEAANSDAESMVYARIAAEVIQEHADPGDSTVAPDDGADAQNQIQPGDGQTGTRADSTSLSASDANVARGLQQHAQEAFQQGGFSQYSNYVGQITNMDMAMFNARDYGHATEATRRLAQAFPQNPDVQHAERQLDTYNMAELDTNAYYYPGSSHAVVGGEGYGVNADLYSAPIDYNWRLFAGTSYAHETEGSAGAVGYNQDRAGVEYRGVSLTAMAAPTNNLYHNSARAGFMTTEDWTFNSAWSAGGGYSSFARDVPLQALNAGVTANKFNADVQWKQDDARAVRFDGNDMQFSDGNNRVAGGLTYLENLYVDRLWRVDAVTNAVATHDSGNEVISYYNPRNDLTGLIGPKVTGILYHRYDTLYEHSLQISPGAYWQQNYGTSPAMTIVYGQSLRLSDTLKGGVSIDYTHQSYDGQPNDDIGFTANLTRRF